MNDGIDYDLPNSFRWILKLFQASSRPNGHRRHNVSNLTHRFVDKWVEWTLQCDGRFQVIAFGVVLLSLVPHDLYRALSRKNRCWTGIEQQNACNLGHP